jgi:hypothetical protein
MWDKIAKMSASDWAAWYGALLATVVGIVQLVKWMFSGPKLAVLFKWIYTPPQVQPRELINIEAAVTNIGSITVTIRKFEVVRDGKCLLEIPVKDDESTLLLGECWLGRLSGIKTIINQQPNARLYLRVYLTHRIKPFLTKEITPSADT